MCTTPKETCLRSFFLKVFFLPFFSGTAAPPAAAGFAIKSVLGRSSLVVRYVAITCTTGFGRRPTANDRFMFLPPLSSGLRPFPCAGPCGFAHWCACAVRGPAGSGDGGSRDRNRF